MSVAVAVAPYLEALLGPPVTISQSRPWWRCPWHSDGAERTPSLTIQRDGHGYLCFACGAHGDAIDLDAYARKVPLAEAMKGFRERGLLATPPSSRPKRPEITDAPEPERGDRWQEAVAELVAECSERLLSTECAGVRRDLGERGLDATTLAIARLGWNPDWRWLDAGELAEGIPHRLRVGPGLVIPWTSRNGTGFDGVNLRSAVGTGPKYLMAAGSTRGLYPGGAGLRDVVLFTEGELDALLLRQGGIPAVTVGGSQCDPRGAVLMELLAVRRWLVGSDADEAGETLWQRWRQSWPRCRRVRPPAPAKDWTDAWRHGWDLEEIWSYIESMDSRKFQGEGLTAPQ